MLPLLSGELGSLTGLLLFAGKESGHTFDSFFVFVRIYLCGFELNFVLQVILEKFTFACLRYSKGVCH